MITSDNKIDWGETDATFPTILNFPHYVEDGETPNKGIDTYLVG